jgi:exosome complex RNA-binding protein Csl4
MQESRDERQTTAGPESGRICARCGARMEERQCKIICTNCGALDDCSDP